MTDEAVTLRREGTQVTLEIRVPGKAILAKRAALLETLGREIQVPGFRPGKAPEHLVIRHFGEDAFWAEVKEHLVEEWLRKALMDHDLRPVTTPKVKDVEFVRGERLVFRAEFEVLPEFEIPEELSIQVSEPPPAEVEEEEVEEALEDLRREAATLHPKDAAAEEGDVVHLRRGERFWEAVATAEKPIPAQLLGAQRGAKVILTSEDGHAEEFEVVGVYTRSLPDPEETARYYGKEDWEALREEVQRQLLRRAEARRLRDWRAQALDALAEVLQIPVPPGLLAEVVEEERARLSNREEVKAEVERAVARRLRREILIRRLADQKDLWPSDEEVQRIAKETGEEEDRVRDRLLFEQAADWVIAHTRRQG